MDLAAATAEKAMRMLPQSSNTQVFVFQINAIALTGVVDGCGPQQDEKQKDNHPGEGETVARNETPGVSGKSDQEYKPNQGEGDAEDGLNKPTMFVPAAGKGGAAAQNLLSPPPSRSRLQPANNRPPPANPENSGCRAGDARSSAKKFLPPSQPFRNFPIEPTTYSACKSDSSG